MNKIEGQSIANEPGIELVGRTFVFTRDTNFSDQAGGSIHEFKQGETIFIATAEQIEQGGVSYFVFYSVPKEDNGADSRGIIGNKQEIREVYIDDFGNVLPLCLTESKRKADSEDSLRKKLESLRTIIPITERIRRAALRVLEHAAILKFKAGEIIAPSPKHNDIGDGYFTENDPSKIGLVRAARVVLAASGDHAHADTFSDGDEEDKMKYLIEAAVARLSGVIKEAEVRARASSASN